MRLLQSSPLHFSTGRSSGTEILTNLQAPSPLLPPPILPPNSKMSSHQSRPSHGPQHRRRFPHPTVRQTALPPRRSPARTRLFATIDFGREDLVFASRESRRVAAEQYEWRKGYQRSGQLEVEAGSRGYAGCKRADGVVAVYELWVAKYGGSC
jgi:hypothetical protein